MSHYFIPERNEINTILNAETELTGDLSFDTSLTIKGSFKGNIYSQGLVIIAESASVEANIYSQNIIIEGNFKGDLLAYNKLELKETAVIHGNLKAFKINVLEGMFFEGDCQTLLQEDLFKEFETKTKKVFTMSIPLRTVEENNNEENDSPKKTLKKSKKPR